MKLWSVLLFVLLFGIFLYYLYTWLGYGKEDVWKQTKEETLATMNDLAYHFDNNDSD